MVFFFLSVIKVFYGASKILPIGLSTGNNTVKKPTKQRVDSNKAIYQPFTRPSSMIIWQDYFICIG